MPTGFLAQRYGTFLEETSGATTVTYCVLDASSKNALTGDIDDSTAYSGTTVELPARISNFPTGASRGLKGQQVDYTAIIVMSVEDLTEQGITPKIGDGIILPGTTKVSFIDKIVPRKQSGAVYLEYQLFLTRNISGRG
jgi:hypothetical protein